MLTMRSADQRGHADHGWLQSHHSFSFGHYYDPDHIGHSILRVINDDTVAPGGGFPSHGHSDMEIISYVISGALEHRDSLGNGSVIRAGDVQRMSAGHGVTHSEYNPSTREPVHFLQIWLEPNEYGVEPGYAQQHFPPEQRRGRLQTLVSPDGRDGSMASHQDGVLQASRLEAGDALDWSVRDDRNGYLHLASGQLEVNGQALNAGDGLRISGPETLALRGIAAADVLIFDLP